MVHQRQEFYANSGSLELQIFVMNEHEKIPTKVLSLFLLSHCLGLVEIGITLSLIKDLLDSELRRTLINFLLLIVIIGKYVAIMTGQQ